jgi:hypothetical protein
MLEHMLIDLIGSVPTLLLVGAGLYLLSTKIDRLKHSIEFYVSRIDRRIDELSGKKE